jgi:DeoR family transcriptional regulator, glycerol-3-phosphate regulon repressor
LPPSFRQTEILEIARREGRVVVEDLARRFDVTLQTIRRDLTELSDTGYLNRVHGGAVPSAGVTNLGYEQRRRMHADAKARIGRACARAIPNHSSIILNLGTTTESVAHALLEHRNITVITNNTNVANILMANSSCDIVVTGGPLRRSDGGLVGSMTAQVFEQFKVDYAIVGASALDGDGDILDFDLAEVRVSETILRQARKAYLVCDHSKLERSAPVRLASLADIDIFFTDRQVPPELKRHCAEWETEIVVAT